MKFDVKKAEDLLYEGKWHIQDHDTKFQFYGILKSIHPDELTFHIMDRTFGISRGTYTFPAGSHFNLHKLRLDKDKKEWIFSSGPNHIIDWKDITEMDDVDDTIKEEQNMSEDIKEEKNVTEWLPCVVSEDKWTINEHIKRGDHICRIFNDKIDIKANMIIKTAGYYVISVHLIDQGIDILNIEIDEKLRVCATHSPDDSGIPVSINSNKFNPELRVGKLYHFTNSNKNIQYMIHVKSITDNAMEVHVISSVKESNGTSSLTVIGRSFDIAELLEYKFKEVNNGGDQ